MRMTTAFVFSAIGLGGGAAMAADVTATSAIDAVTVFPSGAEITRLAKVKIDGGEHRIIFADLPAQAIPQSIRVEGKSTGALLIGSVDTRRLQVPRGDAAQTESERRKIEDQIEALKDARSLLEAQVNAAETQRTLLSNLTELPKVPPPAQGATQQTDWKAVLSTIGTGLADAHKAELDAKIKIRETDRQIKDLQGKLAALAPGRQERTEVAVNVKTGGALEAELIVRYQVASASWGAFYDARLSTGTKTAAPKLDLARRAAISQTTGEEWNNVALSLSTTRPSVGAAAPEVGTTTVDYLPEPMPAPVAMAPAAPAPHRVMAKKAEKAEMADSLNGGALEPTGQPATIREVRQEVAQVTQAAFQAIYGVPGRVSVLPTGEAKRVQLMEEALEPTLSVRTVPKLDAKAYLYAKLTTPKTTPILPGQVSLFRDGTFVGTGRLPALAAGEEHELGFGADDAVRVKYAVLDDKRGEKGYVTSSKTDTRNFRLSVKNLHERGIAVTVFDSAPVSQQQDIKVTVTARPAASRNDVDDKRGVTAWDFKLEPDQEQQIEFGYQVVWPGAKSITYR